MNNIKPLDGIKVVELGTHVAVPNATRWMADWGAEVIKVESIGGEQWRMIGSLYNTPIEDDENPIFGVQNINKKFITIDLRSEEGKNLLMEIISDADVFISNVRLGSLENLGFGYDAVKEVNDQIIYVHFSGFGYKGKDSKRPGFDMAAYWARSGALVDWIHKGDFPIKPTGGFGDATVSAAICSGICAALIGRAKHGKGTFMASSLYNSSIWYNSTGIIATQEKYGAEYPKSRWEPSTPLSHIYECKDGEWLMLTVINYAASYEKMYNLFGLPELNEDPRFTTIEEARKNMPELVKIIQDAFLTKNVDEWMELLNEADVVYEKLAHMEDITKDSQAWDNEFIKELEFPNGEKAVFPVPPIHFGEYDTYSDMKLPGKPSRDADEILKSIGKTDAEINSLRDSKAIE